MAVRDPASRAARRRWRKRQRGFIYLALALLPPLGAVLVWPFTRWPLWAKLAASLWAVVAMLVVLVRLRPDLF